MLTSLSEEADAINWYVQRMSVEPDEEAHAIMDDSLGEEFKHFSMELEFLLRKMPKWREIAQGVLFKSGNIVGHGETAESEAG
jgi:hypothetical protein|nr:hypothetical protein [Cryobacterium tepidiphilum]